MLFRSTRFGVLARTQPDRAAELAELIQQDVDERWRYYEQLAGVHRTVPHLSHEPHAEAAEPHGSGAQPAAAVEQGDEA